MPEVIGLAVVAIVLFMLLSASIKIVQEYERGVIFRLGRLMGARGPGLIFIIPGAEGMRKVDLRIVTLEVPAQEAITRDNVTVKVNAELQPVIDQPTDAWGVKVTSVEVRDVELPQSMQRAMARQAEAEREKRAKIIHAEGEFSAS